ncbi:MAG: hypothetical protein PHN80_04995 [Hespellia sp.]|nr:hypothetical protein [Hespellia sp.]
MKNKKTLAGAICGVLILSLVTVGAAKASGENSVIQEETKASENVRKTTAEAVKDSGTAESESGMVFLQADESGTLKKEDADTNLPVSVKLTYYLDGKEISPKKIAGKSGKVKLRFDYENLTKETVTVDGEERKVSAPFLLLSVVMLPSDTFSNIQVSNGKIMEDDDQNVVVGTVFPALRDSLELDGIEAADDVNLPDYVEITADVSEFELEFTANVMTPLGLSDMNLDSLDDVDELIDDMEKLGEASGALVEGTGALLDGLTTFQSAVGAYTDGVQQLESGIEMISASLSEASMPDDASVAAVSAAAQALAADAATLSQNMEALQKTFTGLQSFAENVAAYKMAIDSAVNGTNEALTDAQSEVSGAAASLENADADASEQARVQAQNVLETAINSNGNLTEEEKAEILAAADYSGINVTSSSEAGENLTAANDNIQEAQNQLTAIPPLEMPDMTVDVSGILETLRDMEGHMKVLTQFSSGMSGLTEGMDTLTAALEQLQSGSRQLASNNETIMSGIQRLVDGARQLQEGQTTFDEEGIQKLQDMADGDLKKLLNRFRAVKAAEEQYESREDAKEKSYVIETDGISF